MITLLLILICNIIEIVSKNLQTFNIHSSQYYISIITSCTSILININIYLMK